MAGYVVSDAINTSVANPRKFFSKSAVSFKIETAGNVEVLNAAARSPLSQAPTRFYDTAFTVSQGGGTSSGGSGMTAEQITYVGMQSTALADSVTIDTATFNSKTIPTPPTGFPAIDQEDFQVYVNGVLIPINNRTVAQSGSNILVTFINLVYNIEAADQIILIGKFS